MTREIARDRELVGPFVTNGVILKLVVASLLSAMAIGLAAALQFDGVRMALVAIGCGGMFIFLVNEVLAGGISGLQRMGKMSAWATIHVYVSSIASVVLLANGAGIVPYTMVMAWSPVILTVALAVLLLPYVRSHLGVDLHLWRVLVVGGAPLVLLTIFNQIYGTVDIPILAALTSTTVVGWYSLAYKWAAIPIFITNAVIGSHYPEMARLGSNPGPEFAGLVNRAVKLTLLASTPAAVGLAVVAPNLIALFYPPGFGPSVRPLQILALQIPITGMDTVLATALIACNRLRRYLVVAGAAAALNPILCAILIQVADEVWDNGAIGAAIATALTELFVMCCALYLSVTGVMDRGMFAWWARCTLAALAILPVAMLSGESTVVLFAQVALGALLYAVAAIALRVLPLDMLRGALGRVRAMIRGRRPEGPPSDSGHTQIDGSDRVPDEELRP